MKLSYSTYNYVNYYKVAKYFALPWRRSGETAKLGFVLSKEPQRSYSCEQNPLWHYLQ